MKSIIILFVFALLSVKLSAQTTPSLVITSEENKTQVITSADKRPYQLSGKQVSEINVNVINDVNTTTPANPVLVDSNGNVVNDRRSKQAPNGKKVEEINVTVKEKP